MATSHHEGKTSGCGKYSQKQQRSRKRGGQTKNGSRKKEDKEITESYKEARAETDGGNIS